MDKINKTKKNKPDHAQRKKSLIIAVTAIGALLVLSLLLLFGRQFVGQAINPGASTVGQAGIFLSENTVAAEKSFTIPIKANIGSSKTNALGFVLNHPGLMLEGACNDAVIIDLPEAWRSKLTVINCANHQIVFSGGTVDPNYVLDREFSIASIKFQGLGEGKYELLFPTFDVIDFRSETNLITEIVSGKIVVVGLGLPPAPPSLPGTGTCGDGVVNEGEACDGMNFGGKVCKDFDYEFGALSCKECYEIDLAGCRNQLCGDGLKDGTETCDDGNLLKDDGCTPLCKIAADWTCTGEPSVCVSQPGALVAPPTELLGDTDENGCLSLREYNNFKYEYKNGLLSDIVLTQYNNLKYEFKNNIGGIACS